MRSLGDVEFEYLMLPDVGLEPCRGCFACFERGEERCPIRDDADGVIFASPVYGLAGTAVLYAAGAGGETDVAGGSTSYLERAAREFFRAPADHAYRKEQGWPDASARYCTPQEGSGNGFRRKLRRDLAAMRRPAGYTVLLQRFYLKVRDHIGPRVDTRGCRPPRPPAGRGLGKTRPDLPAAVRALKRFLFLL